MNVVSLFSGIGGLELGLENLGFRTVCYVENEGYAQKVLVKNMDEGSLSRAPIWDDVRTFDGRRWRGVADLVCGGFPCQDISVAGKGAGIKEGTRSGLWFEFKRVVCEARPRYVLVENVSAITKRGLDTVLAGLSEVGYDAVWFTLQAAEVGALHRRERMFIVGWRRGISNAEIRGEQEQQAGDNRQERRRDSQVEPRSGAGGRGIDGNIAEGTDIGKRTPSEVQADMADADGGGHLHGEPEKFSAEARLSTLGEPEPEGDVAHADGTGNGAPSDEPDGIWEEKDEGRDGLAQRRTVRRCEDVPDADTEGMEGGEKSRNLEEGGENSNQFFKRFNTSGDYWSAEPDVGRVAHGVPSRVDRLRCLGNAVVPQVAREVGKVMLLMEAKK